MWVHCFLTPTLDSWKFTEVENLKVCRFSLNVNACALWLCSHKYIVSLLILLPGWGDPLHACRWNSERWKSEDRKSESANSQLSQSQCTCPIHVPSASAVMSTMLRRDMHGDPWTPSQQKESELATPDSTAVLKLFDLLQPIQLGGPCWPPSCLWPLRTSLPPQNSPIHKLISARCCHFPAPFSMRPRTMCAQLSAGAALSWCVSPEIWDEPVLNTIFVLDHKSASVHACNVGDNAPVISFRPG